jgi:hypothetical protein
MNANEIEQWCQEKGWTQARQLDNGMWVAFPPGGFIENIIPYPTKSATPKIQISWIEIAGEYTVLLISAILVAIIAIIVAPYFLLARFFQGRD